MELAGPVAAIMKPCGRSKAGSPTCASSGLSAPAHAGGPAGYFAHAGAFNRSTARRLWTGARVMLSLIRRAPAVITIGIDGAAGCALNGALITFGWVALSVAAVECRSHCRERVDAAPPDLATPPSATRHAGAPEPDDPVLARRSSSSRRLFELGGASGRHPQHRAA